MKQIPFYALSMLTRPSLFRILILTVLFLSVGASPSWAQKKALVQTKWNRSDGLQAGEEIYFLGNYSLYLPGKVIIPMFIVTDARFLYRDLSTSEVRFFENTTELGNASEDLAYQHADKVAQSEIWGLAGLLPLSEWGLPSPLDYSSRDPKFLKKVIEKQKGDRPPDIFCAAFDNDAQALKAYPDAGADSDSSDDAGRTLLMYAVLGEAPDTMRLLFEAGADPQKKTDSGYFPLIRFSTPSTMLRRAFTEGPPESPVT